MIYTNRIRVSLTIVLTACLVGCSAKLPPKSGFISDYTKLEKTDSNRMRYIGDELGRYNAFIIDPVEFRFEGDLSREHRADLAGYTRAKLVEQMQELGLRVVDEPGVDVARVRIALTDINRAKWYLNIHPVTKATGVGLGGAAMEAEIIDSVTAAQLAAVIRADFGSRLELDMFSTLDDARDAIDKWARQAARAIADLQPEDPSS